MSNFYNDVLFLLFQFLNDLLNEITNQKVQ